jgi:CheY-like chemotaxis protein
MPDLILIALTGWRVQRGDTRAIKAGFRHYLNKPFEPAALSRLVDEL